MRGLLQAMPFSIDFYGFVDWSSLWGWYCMNLSNLTGLISPLCTHLAATKQIKGLKAGWVGVGQIITARHHRMTCTSIIHKWIFVLSTYIKKVTKKTTIFTQKTSIFQNAIYNLLMYYLGFQNAIDNLLMHDLALRNRLRECCHVIDQISITSCVSPHNTFECPLGQARSILQQDLMPQISAKPNCKKKAHLCIKKCIKKMRHLHQCVETLDFCLRVPRGLNTSNKYQ